MATKVLDHIVRSIVDDPEKVRVEAIDDDGTIILEVRVGEGDLGRVIGRRGRTAQNIRALVRAAAEGQDERSLERSLQMPREQRSRRVATTRARRAEDLHECAVDLDVQLCAVHLGGRCQAGIHATRCCLPVAKQ